MLLMNHKIDSITAFGPKEVQKEFKYLNVKKTPGIDAITPKIIKELSKKEILLLTYCSKSKKLFH